MQEVMPLKPSSPPQMSIAKVKPKPSPRKRSTPRKRKTPTKAERAAANTKSILHYFSPKSASASESASPSSNNHSTSNILRNSLEKKQRESALFNSASSKSSIHGDSRGIRDKVSQAVKKLYFESVISNENENTTKLKNRSAKKCTRSAAQKGKIHPNLPNASNTTHSRTRSKRKTSPATFCNGEESSSSKGGESSSNTSSYCNSDDSSSDCSEDDILAFAPFHKKSKNIHHAETRSNSNTNTNNGIRTRTRTRTSKTCNINIHNTNSQSKDVDDILSFAPFDKTSENDATNNSKDAKSNGFVINIDDSSSSSGSSRSSSEVEFVSVFPPPPVKKLKKNTTHSNSKNKTKTSQLECCTDTDDSSSRSEDDILSFSPFDKKIKDEDHTVTIHSNNGNDQARPSPSPPSPSPPRSRRRTRAMAMSMAMAKRSLPNETDDSSSSEDDAILSFAPFDQKMKAESEDHTIPVHSNNGNDQVRQCSSPHPHPSRRTRAMAKRSRPREAKTSCTKPIEIPRPVKISPEPPSANASETTAIKIQQRTDSDDGDDDGDDHHQSPASFQYGMKVHVDPNYAIQNVTNAADDHAPQIGDHLRVVNPYMEDLFNGAKGNLWTIGVVEDLKMHTSKAGRGTYTLNVRYSDGITDDLQYPDEDVEIVIQKEQQGQFFSLSGSFAYDSNPSSLFIGDYVECYFQNGKDNGHWWQGRIAFVSSDQSFANIAYFDGQYEVGIPTNRDHIRLIARGSFCAKNWLSGTNFANFIGADSNFANLEVVRVFTKCSIDHDLLPMQNFSDKLWCEVKNINGSEQVISYETIVKELFSVLRSESITKIWPGYNPIINCSVYINLDGQRSVLLQSSNEDIEVEVETDHEDPIVHSSIFIRLNGKRSLLLESESNGEEEESDVESEHHEDPCCNGGTIWINPPNFDLESCNPFVAFSKNELSCTNADKIEISQDSLDESSDDDDNTSHQRGQLISGMHPSIANSCWIALNSAEVQNGFGLLSHLVSSWAVFPNRRINHCFTKFLVRGPEYEGKLINAPHRTETAFMYMRLIFEKSQYNNDEHPCTRKVGPPSSTDFKDILELPTKFTVHGTEAKSTIAQSLQFSSKSLSFVANSLKLELEDIINGTVHPTVQSLYSRPLVSQILTMDLHECLVLSVKSSIAALIQHGHWLFGNPGTSHQHSQKTPNDHLCAKESQSCFNALGSIVSHVSFLFCTREKISFGNERCCLIIQEAVYSMINDIDFSTMKNSSKRGLTNGDEERFKKDLKLRFLFSLDSLFSRTLQISLSKRFGLSEVFLILS